jgi:hypothetical protein
MLAFTLTMFDDGAKVEHAVWRELLERTLAQGDEGLVLCAGEGAIVFTNERGRELVDRFAPTSGIAVAARFLPAAVADAVAAELAQPTPGGRSVEAVEGRSLVVVAARVAAHAYVAVWLREAPA